MRHTSSGGSSTDLYRPKKSKLIHHRSTRRTRQLTESSKSADGDDLDFDYENRKKHRSKEEATGQSEENSEENYDEFDLMADVKDRPNARTRTDSGPGFLRSLSDCVPQSIGAATGSACSHIESDDDGASMNNLRTRQKIMFAAKHRRQIHGKRRDYTSITDELELMIAASPPIDMHETCSSPSPQPLPSIQVLACL